MSGTTYDCWMLRTPALLPSCAARMLEVRASPSALKLGRIFSREFAQPKREDLDMDTVIPQLSVPLLLFIVSVAVGFAFLSAQLLPEVLCNFPI